MKLIQSKYTDNHLIFIEEDRMIFSCTSKLLNHTADACINNKREARMPLDLTLITAMCAFSLAMSITPGPVNMIIVSSGVNHGVRSTMPFVSGATIGFTLLLISIGFGLINIINYQQDFLKYLTVVGASFIIYLGYKIIRSKDKIQLSDEKPKISTFSEGFLLQWLNPKAWIACVSGASLFSSSENNMVFITFSICYFLICYASLSFWAIMGWKITALLKRDFHLRVFNFITGGLLICSAFYLTYSVLVR
jgi:threonine/homoserine/homoserine lactone efflux protein